MHNNGEVTMSRGVAQSGSAAGSYPAGCGFKSHPRYHLGVNVELARRGGTRNQSGWGCTPECPEAGQDAGRQLYTCRGSSSVERQLEKLGVGSSILTHGTIVVGGS